MSLEDKDELEDEDEEETPPASGAPVELTVTHHSYEGARLDHFLRDSLPDRSRALLQKHVEVGAVTIAGVVPKRGAKTLIHVGDVIRYTPPAPQPTTLIPQNIPLSILFEDEHLIVVDKQRDLVVHPAAGHPDGTLVNALLHHFGRDVVQASNTVRPGIVHRLDRDTTGAMVVAKTERAHELLGNIFHERKVSKRYFAVTHGVPKNAKDTLETFYGRHPKERKKFSSKVLSGKSAITRYEVQENFGIAAQLAVDLETGRTHQIRVHLADLGHPLVGDTTYGKRVDVREPKTNVIVARFDRPALHAHHLAFDHPITGARVDITAPIPDDLVQLIVQLRKRGPR